MNLRTWMLIPTLACSGACQELSYEEKMKDCLTVDPVHVQNILDGMTNPADRGKFALDHVYAVRSKDRSKIYFVSGFLRYVPFNTNYDVGTWVLNNVGSEQSFYWAMPGVATEHTVYPNGSQNKAQISEYDHGYVQSHQCSRTSADGK